MLLDAFNSVYLLRYLEEERSLSLIAKDYDQVCGAAVIEFWLCVHGRIVGLRREGGSSLLYLPYSLSVLFPRRHTTGCWLE